MNMSSLSTTPRSHHHHLLIVVVLHVVLLLVLILLPRPTRFACCCRLHCLLHSTTLVRARKTPDVHYKLLIIQDRYIFAFGMSDLYLLVFCAWNGRHLWHQDKCSADVVSLS